MSKLFESLLSTTKFVTPKSNESLLRDSILLEDISDGARIKKWILKDDVKFLYKSSKVNPFGEYTYEHLSEYLSMRIGRMISVPTVDIILGEYSILSKVMSNSSLKSFIELSDEFSHSFHLSNLKTYNISTLLNKKNNPYWKEVIEMLLFDAIIGNSDRHPGNFLYNEDDGFYPLFDNGSSLCAYERDVNIKDILRDANRFQAINITKSKPVLRDNQKITHKRLVEIIKDNYPKEFNEFCIKINNLNLNNLFDGLSLKEERKDLIYEFLKYRIEWFK